MGLTHEDRYRIKSQVHDVLVAWSVEKRHLLFGEFGLADTSDGQGRPVHDVLNDVQDVVLVELYAIVMNVDPRAVVEVAQSVSDVGWHPGYVRVFLSHSARHKAFAAQVAGELAVIGVHGFVAHEAIEHSRPWQAEVEHALRTMQAFVAIVHPEFNTSPWCNQEAGWALGRGVPRYAVLVGVDPDGFIRDKQWPRMDGGSPKHVAEAVSAWAAKEPLLGPPIIERLFSEIRGAGNWVSAGAAARRVAALGTLSEIDFARLDAIWASSELSSGALVKDHMEPFYRRNGRAWRHSKPA